MYKRKVDGTSAAAASITLGRREARKIICDKVRDLPTRTNNLALHVHNSFCLKFQYFAVQNSGGQSRLPPPEFEVSNLFSCFDSVRMQTLYLLELKLLKTQFF